MKIGDKYTYNNLSNNTVTRNFKGLCGNCGEQPIESNTYCRNCKKYFGKEYLCNIEKKNIKSKGLFDIDTEYVNIVDNFIDRACKQDKSLKVKEVLDILYDRYNHKFIEKINYVERIDTINMAFQLGYDDIVTEMYMSFFEMMSSNFNINCNHINNFPKLNKVDENKIYTCNKVFIKNKKELYNIYSKFISFKTNFIKIKKQRISYKTKLEKEREYCNSFKSKIKNIKDEIDNLEKEYDEILKNEQKEQLKKLYNKLKENKNIKIKEDNNICKLMNKLQNQKVDKLYILSDIG